MADPALKLFGRTIQLGDVGLSSGSDLNPSCENKEKNNGNRSGEDRETAPTEPDQSKQSSTSSLNMNQDGDQQASSNNTAEGEKPDSTGADNPEEKGLKKPDKILPCPRCNSLDTKFCYYNNYNVNQPRHFCKNCQRYWTAGGTMRNVPVGAGRRKNKHSVPHFRPIVLPSPEPNGTILKFESPPSPFSPTPALDEQMRRAEISTASDRPSSTDAPARIASVPSMQYYPGPSWAFSWGVPTVLGPGPAFCAPLPFVPAPFWPAPFVPLAPALGKHSRDGEERSLWAPKTLRIDDPDEAAKSSIWSTLGIEPDEGGMFKGCRSKAKSEDGKVEASSPSLVANPAALSRSQSFQEGI